MYPSPARPLLAVDTIKVSDIPSAQWFFSNYVHKRVPVKILGLISDPSWKGEAWKDLNYLKLKCAECIVKIERKSDGKTCGNDFGNGLESSMRFGDFIEALQGGDESLYMTTQPLKRSPEGEPDIVSAPLSELTGDFPWRPSLLGNLIVQNINIWIGRSSEGSCSGLHHDYHDNLYMLLKGSKSFKLFSPVEQPNMYCHGELLRIHPNGRINYVDQPTRADGAAVGAEKALQAAIKLDQMAKKLEQGYESDAEEAIEAALEELLDAQMEDCSECSDESGDDEASDEEPHVDSPSQLSKWLGMDSCSSDEDLAGRGGPGKRKRSINVASEVSQSSVLKKSKRIAYGAAGCCTESNPDGHQVKSSAALPSSLRMAVPKGPPSNFSKVVTSLSDEEISKDFPLFSQARSRQLNVTLNENEMLYLPCGWFHEVTSMNPRGCGSGDPGECHMAVNYWFHPPDGDSYQAPYADEFWEESWRRRSLV